MEEEVKGLQDYIAMFKRNKNKMMLIAAILFLLSVIIAVKWPATYKSSAIILIEQQEIPQDLVRSTVTSYADQRIQVISQRVMSSANLKKIIKKYGLYEDEIKKEPISVVVEDMREDIHLDMVSADVVDPVSGRPTQATIAFTLSFEHESPQKAQQVANELVNLYLDENLKRRSEVATQATSFLAMEAEKLAEQIAELEKELADFKERNSTSLPELQQLNMNLMDRTDQQIMDTDRQITSLNERILYLEAELAQIDPNMSVYSATGERIYGSQDRLKSLQAEYVGLKARYSSNHPDVVKMKKEIEALEKEVGGIDKTEIVAQLKDKRGKLAALTKRYSPQHPDVKKLKQVVANLEKELKKPSTKRVAKTKPDNPAYIQLLAQLNAAKSDLRSMRATKDKLMDKLDSFQEGLLKAPQVEREYQDLTRNYENAILKYREVKAKQMEADMSQAMEQGRKAERFSLIEPPLFPDEPDKPNRKVIVLLGFILSIGAALAYALVKESINQNIYGSKGMLAATGAYPLVVVPYIENEEDLEEAKKMKLKITLAAIVTIIIVIVLFHFFVMPLDVLWYVLNRKMS
jgi:uncharacterized protein involved in exopolysaccharide biosynthesis